MTTETFDLTGPLPPGTQLLEASAGTGKTFTIAALATRFIAEGVCTVDQLLLITFSKAAAKELRERVRQRLVATARALGEEVTPDGTDPAITAVGSGDPPDPVVALLRTGSAEQVDTRRQRLLDAVAGFDLATIDTTHSFCQQALHGLGITADIDPQETFLEDVVGLAYEIAGDLVLARYADPKSEVVALSPDEARALARAVATDPQASLAPATADDSEEALERLSFAEAVRAEMTRRQRLRGLTSFDGLLAQVAAAVTDPVNGAAACDMLRARFPVVMVDEFQDTDPLQWQILQTVFHEHSRLILIGDPKQAIYAFRGGDIDTYLLAERVAHGHSTLDTNHRTDRPLVDAVVRLFGDTHLGDELITVKPVDSRHEGPRLSGGPELPALSLRCLPEPGTSRPVGELRELIDRDVTDQCITLLTSGAQLHGEDGSHPVRPGDIAVLVFDNKDARRLRETMRAAGLDAVITGNDNVYGSDAASAWATLLAALEQPTRPRLVRDAMISPFLGYSGDELIVGGDALVDSAAETLLQWLDRFRAAGIAGIIAAADPTMTPRLLTRPDGERLLTDLHHIGEDLHALSRTTGLSGLSEWLAEQRRDSSQESDEAARRLDTDADAVQIMTVHKSKGLEFPVVMIPFAWYRWLPNKETAVRFHDAAGRRMLDVRGPGGVGWADHLAAHRAEDAGERLRLLYVALTRASCRATVWWARNSYTKGSPLQRLIGARHSGEVTPAEDYPPTTIRITEAEAVLGIRAIEAEGRGLTMPARPQTAAEHLCLAEFARSVDTTWRRTSYTALTAAAHDRAHGDPDSPGAAPDDDEPRSTPAPEPLSNRESHDTDDLRSPMADLPVGAGFGVVVHQVYELFDGTRTDVLAELTRCAEAALTDRPVDGVTAAELAAALVPGVLTPLGPLAAGRTLQQLSPGDRLAELDFELPLAGGDRCTDTTAPPTLAGIAALMRAHLEPDDPLAAYPDRMVADGLSSQQLVGFLTGSIDAVFRVPTGPAGADRFVVADYKTNWVGGSTPDRRLTVGEYHPGAMAEAMMSAHYPLQALLYQVALHRYLRWRVPGYDPDVHLGGVLYLFVRGMVPTTGDPVPGVMEWSPPPSLVAAVSDLLQEGAP